MQLNSAKILVHLVICLNRGCTKIFEIFYPCKYCTVSQITYSDISCQFCFFFSYSKLMYMKNKQYKPVLGSLFNLERSIYCSTFTINIESSFIHSMKYLFACKQIYMYNIIDIPFSCVPKACF